MKLRGYLINGLICTFLFLAWTFFSGCATLKINQPQLQTYTFNLAGKEYSALLPELVPMPPENARFKLGLWRGEVYALHIHYLAGRMPIPAYPVASFWFTRKLGVVGLAWHTLKPDGTMKHETFLYVKGFPIPKTENIFDKFLHGLISKLEFKRLKFEVCRINRKAQQ